MPLLCALTFAGLLPGSAHADRLQDNVLSEAYTAWRSKNVSRLTQIAQQHHKHTLAPYFDYWRVVLTPENATIRPYLERYPGTALAEQLRADWIRGLGRHGDWATIAQQAKHLESCKNDVRCWILRARWETGDKTAIHELMADWLVPGDFFEPCVPMAEAAVKSGRVSVSDLWARARRLTEAGQYNAARRTLRWLPANLAPSGTLLDNALGRPEHLLTRSLYDARQPASREMVAFAIVRIANDSPDRAAGFLTPGLGGMTAEQRGWAYGHLALVAARKLHPRALEWFRHSGPARLSDEHYAWWARTAARDGAWTDVGVAIEHMSAPERATSTWQYWLGRSLAQRGQPVAAAKSFARAAATEGFYGILAGEELGGRNPLPPPGAPPSAGEVAEVARDPAIQRATALLRADFRTEGLREWDWAVRKADDRRLHAAARYFEQSGMWDRVVETADRAVRMFDLGLRYPFAHGHAVRINATAVRIDPALVFSVARQESRFYTSARSLVGATGLMQVMPATGAAVAKSIGLSGQTSRLHEVDFNLRIGSQYLKSLIDDLGNPMLAFAAYNAGPGRALSWRGTKPMDAAAYAESIPYDETRDYVKRVAANAHYYQTRLSGTPGSLKSFLGQITAGAQQAVAAPPEPKSMPPRQRRLQAASR